MFVKNIDFKSRDNLLDYLKTHFRYYTMNSWNRTTSYAQCVKIHCLDIPEHLRDMAYELACGQLVSKEFEAIHQALFDQFRDETGYALGFNGRSNGYIVMYQTAVDPKTGRIVTYPGRGIDQDTDELDEMDFDELRERAEIVQKFDQTVDTLRDYFVKICESYSGENQSNFERVPVNRVEHLYDVLVPKDGAQNRVLAEFMSGLN